MNGTPARMILDQLPTLQPCAKLRLKRGDTIVHAPGFEDRTLAFAKGFSAEPGAHAILLDYRPKSGENKLKEVAAAFAKAGVDCTQDSVVEYDRFDPSDFEARLSARLETTRTKRVVVDISTMSKLAILLVLQVCKQWNLDTRIHYSEAIKYGPTEEEFENARTDERIHRPTLHGFTGVHGVVRVDSLASVAMQGQPTAAIVFMSFNNALTQSLLNTVYPGRLFLVNGQPPTHSWRESATAWVHEQVRREWAEDNPIKLGNAGPEIPERATSTLDYRESVSLLLDLYWQLSATHRVLLAPSGSKMQAVACYILKALHPDIHIEYPSLEGFVPEYSSGIGARWLIDFGKFAKQLEAIQKAERRTFLEIAV